MDKRADADYEVFSVVTLGDAEKNYNDTIAFIRQIENVVANNITQTMKES